MQFLNDPFKNNQKTFLKIKNHFPPSHCKRGKKHPDGSDDLFAKAMQNVLLMQNTLTTLHMYYVLHTYVM